MNKSDTAEGSNSNSDDSDSDDNQHEGWLNDDNSTTEDEECSSVTTSSDLIPRLPRPTREHTQWDTNHRVVSDMDTMES